MLLPSQKKALWEHLAKLGEDPTRYELYEETIGRGDRTVEVLGMRSDEWFFSVESDGDRFDVAYTPGDEAAGHNVRATWTGVLIALRDWVGFARREREVIDPWDAREALQELLDGEEDDDALDDTPYDVADQDRFDRALQLLDEQLQAMLGMGDEVASLRLYVSRQIADLRAALPSKSRRAWREMLRDFVVNIAATLSIELGGPTAGRVLEIAQHALPTVLGG